jgi:hypothetical protein
VSGPPPGNTLPAVAKPVIIETDGVLGELETGQIINAGGTSNPTFTVAGEQVLTAGSIVGVVCTGYEYTQNSPALVWNINHNGNTLRATVTIYDTIASPMTQILPDSVQVIDPNNVRVTFASPQAGIALVILF